MGCSRTTAVGVVLDRYSSPYLLDQAAWVQRSGAPGRCVLRIREPGTVVSVLHMPTVASGIGTVLVCSSVHSLPGVRKPLLAGTLGRTLHVDFAAFETNTYSMLTVDFLARVIRACREFRHVCHVRPSLLLLWSRFSPRSVTSTVLLLSFISSNSTFDSQFLVGICTAERS